MVLFVCLFVCLFGLLIKPFLSVLGVCVCVHVLVYMCVCVPVCACRYITILVEMVRFDGTHKGKVMASQMLDVTIRVRDVRQFSVKQMVCTLCVCVCAHTFIKYLNLQHFSFLSIESTALF